MTREPNTVESSAWNAKTRALAACLEVLLWIDRERNGGDVVRSLFVPTASAPRDTTRA